MTAEIKPIAGLNRVKLSEVVPLETPFTLFVFPTTYCNFKCVYCGHSLGHQNMFEQYGFKPEHMTMETFTKVIEQASEFPAPFKVVSLTGHGEPLLNPYIADMIRMVKEKNIAKRVEIISNASLLTKDKADGLIESGLDTLRISIQGISSKKYKDMCKYDIEFNELVSNISYFYKHKNNCDLFVKIMDVALEEGETEKFYQIFDKITDRMYIEHCRPVYTGVKLTENMEFTADRYGRQHKPRKVCPLCFYMLSVFPNGDVEPCDTIYKPIVLGNIHQETLKSMWQGKAHKKFQQMQLELKRHQNAKCAGCCAPDDVAHPEDDLDANTTAILKRMLMCNEAR